MHWRLLVTMMQPLLLYNHTPVGATLQQSSVQYIAGQGCHCLIPRLISEILSGVFVSKTSSGKTSKIRLSCQGMTALVRSAPNIQGAQCHGRYK